MELTIALEKRFYRTPDDRYWTDSVYPRPFWSRYLTVFEGVNVLARVHPALAPANSWKRVDGDGVAVAAIPAYVGPSEFIRKLPAVRAAVRRAVGNDSAMLLRVPGMVAVLTRAALPQDRPYGVEVLGDPREQFSPGAVPHPLRWFFRSWFARTLTVQCREAACALYVTAETLQRRYPPGSHRLPDLPEPCKEKRAVGVSDVELPAEAFVEPHAVSERAAARPAGQRFRIVFVGTLEVPYKGLDVLIRALARCLRAGLDAELVVIGSGRQGPAFASLAGSVGVADRVTFLGSLPAGEAIRQQLDASDLFVLPSRVEGLPRAMVEAMARGLPCIGTRVGGLPELLSEHAMVTPGDVKGLAGRILQLASDPRQRTKLGHENLATARRYREEVLQPRRIAFYRCLRELTSIWRRAHAASETDAGRAWFLSSRTRRMNR
jgi:glycosyltransferase involved in cell wall biosynthesis